MLLGLSTGVLDIIENDCRGKAESCCNSMLEKWLDTDHTASWRKLFDAGVVLPEVEPEVLEKDNGKTILCT